MLNYLLKVLIQTVYHLIAPYCWNAYMGYKERMVMTTQRFKISAYCATFSLSLLIIISVHSDIFPSLLAIILSLYLNFKYSKAIYTYFYRLEKK